MTIYICIALLLFFFVLIQNDKNKNILLLLSVIILFIMSGWRAYSVGTDTLNYKLGFDSQSTDFRFLDIRSNEILFPYLIFFIKFFEGDYRVFLIVISFIYCLLVYIVSRFCDKNSLLALLFLFLLGHFFLFYNVSRQEIAVLLSFCAYIYLKRDKKISFFLIVLFSTLLHTSVIVAFLFYPIDKMKIKKKWIAIIPILLFITFLMPFIFDTSSFMETLGRNFSLIGDTYNIYFDSVDKSLFSWNRLFMNVFFAFLPFLDKFFSKKNCYYNFVLVYLIILNMFPFSGVVSRIAMYFSVFLIPYFCYFAKQNKYNYLLVILYSIVIFSFNMSNNIGGIVPYIYGN